MSHGKFIEGSFQSHGIPLPDVKDDKAELQTLQDWLDSYHIKDLIDLKTGQVNQSVLSVIPHIPEKRMGQRKETYREYEPLAVPSWMEHGVQKMTQESCMKAVGRFLLEVSQL
jgi:xylulose-5-phosphate/fructose-6-phosphate phosphoketolase